MSIWMCTDAEYGISEEHQALPVFVLSERWFDVKQFALQVLKTERVVFTLIPVSATPLEAYKQGRVYRLVWTGSGGSRTNPLQIHAEPCKKPSECLPESSPTRPTESVRGKTRRAVATAAEASRTASPSTRASTRIRGRSATPATTLGAGATSTRS